MNEIGNIDLEQIYSRTKLVIGEDALTKLKNSKVCICGVGGVGSFAMEALVRIGVGYITVVDKDDAHISNINRQIIATLENINMPKVVCAIDRIKSINPNIQVKGIKEYIDENNISKIVGDADYVIDAIDSIDSKVGIINYCKENNINVISSMGMANKINPLSIKVADIEKTSVCPLAKVMRKRLKEIGINKVKVVYTEEMPIKRKENEGNILGSVSFVPSVAGLVIASEVVKDIISG